MVAAGLCDEALVQVAYAIGVAEPVGLYVNTYGTAKVDLSDGEIARELGKIFDMRPYAIEKRFKLRTPIYLETAAYGHMGRKPVTITKTFNKGKANEKSVKVELFPWEKLDYVSKIKRAFGIR
jgi:S-adenosylmethionine synthetase